MTLAAGQLASALSCGEGHQSPQARMTQQVRTGRFTFLRHWLMVLEVLLRQVSPCLPVRLITEKPSPFLLGEVPDQSFLCLID